MAIYDDALAAAGRYGDDAVAAIRRMLGYAPTQATPLPPASFDNIVAEVPAATDMSLGSPTWGQMSGAADRNAQVVRGQSGNLRNQPFAGIAGQAARASNEAARAAIEKTFRNRDLTSSAAAAGAAATGAAGVGVLSNQMKKSAAEADAKRAPQAMTSTAGTAELANESRPAPAVEPSAEDEAAFTDTFKRQYTARENKRKAQGAGSYPKPAAADPRAEAQALMADLNDRRKKAGGEVPDGPQTVARINQLLSMSNQQRNSRSPSEASAYAKSNPTDYHAQAQALIADLNRRATEMGGTPPDMQQTLAEVRRLQALGDQQRNAAQTRR